MKILIREGSAAKNFDTLYPLIDLYPYSVMLCTDDSHPDDLEEKHINDLIKRGLKKGLNLFNLLRSATYNPVQHYKIPVGLLQINDFADFIIIDNFEDFNVLDVYIDGKLIKQVNGKSEKTNSKINNFKRKSISKIDLKVKNVNGNFKVICAKDGDLVTQKMTIKTNQNQEFIESDIQTDILKIVVVNRYENESKPVVGFIKNFGLKNGAIGGSVAHDSHNIVAVGTNDEDLETVINKIIELKGGIALSNSGIIEHLELPIAGLMSDNDPNIVAKQYRKMNQKAISELGSTLKNPFMTLSFMSLLVIPELKIGDKGLFDSNKFELTNLFE